MGLILIDIQRKDLGSTTEIFALFTGFSRNTVSDQKNLNSSLLSRAIANIFFKGLNESKLLPERIFYSWFLG
jgi:hypothetical protein